MLRYVCEKNSRAMCTEISLFKQALAGYKYGYTNREVIDVTLEELDTVDAELIPVGDLDFVEKQLSRQGYKMNPIEVPKILRTTEFLGRDYHIVSYSRLPKDGYWFLKDVSRLKSFSGCMHMDIFYKYNDLSKEHRWLYTNVLNLVAEYRFYILNDKIVTYAMYAFLQGYLEFFPDITKVKKIIKKYSTVEHPKAYTIDVGVTIHEETYILEIHPFVSVGVYNTAMCADELIDMVDGGYAWYKSKGNTSL